jgi:hypothetical protein
MGGQRQSSSIRAQREMSRKLKAAEKRAKRQSRVRPRSPRMMGLKGRGIAEADRTSFQGTASNPVKSPLATGPHDVGENGRAAGALSASAASHPLPRHVAKPWTEEPDAKNPHVRSCGSLGGVIP